MSKVACLVGTVLLVSVANIAFLYLSSSTPLIGLLLQPQETVDADKNFLGLTSCNVNLFDIVRNGTILIDGEVLRNERQRVDEQVHRHLVSPIVEYQERPLGVLLHGHDATYYHSLVEFGSRLQFTLDNCPSPQIRWLIRASPSQNKLLELLHNPPILNLIQHDPGINYSSQIVLIPPPPYRVDDLFRLRASLMRRALPSQSLDAAPAVAPARPTILYVQRVARRAIENEGEVLAIFLASFPGNLVIFPETGDLPLVDAIAAFHRADHVLGGHGAGLANIIFCRPGRRVFEIRRPGTPSEFVAQLAAIARLAHFPYADPLLKPHQRALHYSNYTVSPRDFRAFVRAAAADAASAAAAAGTRLNQSAPRQKPEKVQPEPAKPDRQPKRRRQRHGRRSA